VGLQLLLQKQPDGTGAVLVLPFRVTGRNADRSPAVQDLYPMAVGIGGVGRSPDVDFSVELRGVDAYTLLIAKQDPGQGFVWLAFLNLISGLVITFYLPRRRVWTRLGADGELRIAGRADRYVDFEREFTSLLDDLVRVRQPGSPPSGGSAATAAFGQGND
jgi:cytochrome c biogenesis protein ResB